MTITVIAITLIATPTANALSVQTADHLMGYIASHQQPGYLDDWKPIPWLVKRVLAGHRIYVTCGTVSDVGIRIAEAHHIPARAVTVVTLERHNDVDDYHVMLELWVSGRWVLYDLDLNRVAVNASGAPIGIAGQMAANPRHWRLIAHDSQDIDWRNSPHGVRWVLRRDRSHGLTAWYGRLMGAVSIGDVDQLVH